MSEKLYALLLRLYPSRFRETYGDDALQLFRDRVRHEAGLFSRVRLCQDLLTDLLISVPREYFHAQPELLTTSPARSDSSPSFYVLGQQPPRLGALALGTMFSCAALFTFSSLLGVGGHLPISARRGQAASPYSSARTPPSVHSETRGFFATRDAASSSASPETTSSAPMPSDNSQPPESQNAAPDSRAPISTVSASATLDAAERHRVVTATAANLKKYYAYPDVAEKMAEALLRHERKGDDATPADGDGFAKLLTQQMRAVSLDLHLVLVYSERALPERILEPTSESLARYRETMRQENCTFEKVELLPHHIGYFKLNSFPDPSVCHDVAVSAMERLNHARAIIFDLRENRGGQPEMVAFFASYLFDHPEYFYNPRENTTRESWTQSPVAGNLLADKPVYILTSSSTYSGAEQFCYDLKMLKRAMLIGERTGGAAHSGVFHRIDEHFGMGIPETKPINPYATPDWAETGVDPDVPVSAADALKRAQELALARIQKP